MTYFFRRCKLISFCYISVITLKSKLFIFSFLAFTPNLDPFKAFFLKFFFGVPHFAIYIFFLFFVVRTRIGFNRNRSWHDRVSSSLPPRPDFRPLMFWGLRAKLKAFLGRHLAHRPYAWFKLTLN